MKIPTKDSEGRPNGWIMPIWNALEQPELRPEQVYVTAIAPGMRKGPHLHMKRRGAFCCIAGMLTIKIGSMVLPTQTPGCAPFCVEPGIPVALYNYGDTETLVLNMPSPAWSAEDPDDHPVNEWKDPSDWPPQASLCARCQHDGDAHDSGGCCRMNFCECQRFEVKR